jgi:hypothetical protein
MVLTLGIEGMKSSYTGHKMIFKKLWAMLVLKETGLLILEIKVKREQIDQNGKLFYAKDDSRSVVDHQECITN